MNTVKRTGREREPVTHERFGRGLAGLTVMATVVLGYLHSPYWLLVALGVAANLALSALTDRCAVKNLLIRLGLPGERDLGRAEALGIELSHEAQEAISEAPLDREGLHECLTNLVGNAIDACQMSEDGEDGAGGEDHDGGGTHVRMRTFEKDGALVFEVEDDGCGMDYEVKRKVFTTFFTTKGLGGTGLGLLTTRKIVQEHGGRIELESEPGKGTTFRIVLPRDRLPDNLPASDPS